MYFCKLHFLQNMTLIVRSLRGGQITIPALFREKLGIDTNSLLQMTLDGDELCLKPVRLQNDKAAGSAWLKELYDYFASVRKDMAKYSESEINKAIDDAVRAVRSSHKRA